MSEFCDGNFSYCWNNQGEYAAYFYVHMPLGLIGIVSNSVTLLIFRKPPFQACPTTFTLLKWMAVADLLACILIAPIALCRCIKPLKDWQTYVQQFYEIYMYIFVANWFGCVSTWLTTIVSLERYISVAYALEARHYWTLKFTNIIIACTYVASFSITIPFAFMKHISPEPPPQYTDWGASKGAYIFSWFRLALTKAIPILAMLILNILLLKALWHMNKKHNKIKQSTLNASPNRNEMQIRATAMVISVSIVYIVCHTLEPLTQASIFVTVFNYCPYGPEHKIAIVIGNIGELFTFSTNFFFYCIFNKCFIIALKGMFCSKKNKVQGTTTNVVHTNL